MRYFDVPESSAGTDARVVIIPVPYEATTSYGGGTALGPRAIFEASSYVELYDEELQDDPYTVGITSVDPLDVTGSPSDIWVRIEDATARVARDGRLPVMLGGEHSITPAAVRGVARHVPRLTVIQFDAHADLREEYQGSKDSHACAMARVRETAPAVQIGIRSLSRPEAELIVREKLPVFFAHRIKRDPHWIDKAVSSIATDDIYVTIDVDVFDGAILPETGTPEPGGLDWYEVTGCLKKLAEAKHLVGLDIVELAPREGRHASDFMVAKLLYKCIGYWKQGR